MQHYDYPALSGPVEDAQKFAQKLAQDTLASIIPQLAGKQTQIDAFDMFRFGKAGLSKDSREKKVEKHEVTSEFNEVMDKVKFLANPFLALTAPKDMSSKDKEAVHRYVWGIWKSVWDSIVPAEPAAAAKAAKLPAFRIQPGFRPPSFIAQEKKSKFPVLPVVLVAAAAGAFLLMRKKG